MTRYGHWGRPVLAFPAECGDAWEWEREGMVAALGPLLDAGRIKLYCVDTGDAASWSDRAKPLEHRAHAHEAWEAWVVGEVVPWIRADCGGRDDVIATGTSMGAFHAANLALKHADAFPLAVCLSGNYDPPSWHGWGERGEATYFNAPLEYVPNLHGGHLDWLRSRLSLLLVAGQGRWEDTTGALESTRRLAHAAWAKELRCELDVWGYDVPHDWSSWRSQAAHHFPRFC